MSQSQSKRWEERLTLLHAGYLAELPLRQDASASPAVLARRASIRQSLPAGVSHFSSARTQAVRLDLSGSFSFTRRPLTTEARAFLDEVESDRIVAMTPPGGDVVWVALDADGDPRHPLSFALDRSLALRTEDELERRQAALDRAFAAIGWRPVVVPTPRGVPDRRIGAVARIERRGGPRPITAADLVRGAKALATIASVPDEVDAAIHSARLLYVRGWHQWEFFTLAQRESVFALETAARHLIEDRVGRQTNEPLVKLLDKVGLFALLSDWERETADELRARRNAMTHPRGGQIIEWISWARGDIEHSVRLINLMWARYRATVPVDLGWETST